jgi:SAM-dependent methyltransferase
VTQATETLLDLDVWCTTGAREKAFSVASLAADRGIRTVLEVGCGTGVVLAELDDLDFGDRYWACEPMAELCDLARAKAIGRMVDIACTTFEEETFAGQPFDLIILSHVLEHVLNPAELLSRALHRARYVILEVPIEANMAGNLRSAVRRRLTGRPRTVNAAGHIQFFSTSDAKNLVRWSGGEIMNTRLYFPTESHNAVRQAARGPRRLYLDGISGAARVVGPRALAHLYYGHFALLVRQRERFERDWGHPLFWRPPTHSTDQVADEGASADEAARRSATPSP